MSSISKACLELSNSIKGFRLGRPAGECSGGSQPKDASSSPPMTMTTTTTATTTTAASASSRAGGAASTVTGTISRAIKSATSRMKGFERIGPVAAPACPPPAVTLSPPSPPPKPPLPPPPLIQPPPAVTRTPLPNVWREEAFLAKFFHYLSPAERCVAARVCRLWRDVMYGDAAFWSHLSPVLRCRDWGRNAAGRRAFYDSLARRQFDSIYLFGATDSDALEFAANFPASRRAHIRELGLRCSNVSDAGLEAIVERLCGVTTLELTGCNEITEAGLWSCLNVRIVSLTISDCINIADDSIGAIAQLLPALTELSLQAYHVTDAALVFFSAKQSQTLLTLRLRSCWEITNHGIVNVIHSLPNLTALSLSGCSKVSDDGVELIAENLRKLRSLDLSWCPRVTDAALEYIACDLGQLDELLLDRCAHITDIGVGYLSTMTSLRRLFLRWCTQLRDFGLQHIYTMKNLRVLSLAGCNLLTADGLMGLAQLRCLDELEITNCPAASRPVTAYLRQHLPACLVVD